MRNEAVHEILPASEADWHALRRWHVGSSESAALFGASPYMTAFEMAVAKKRGIELFRENERTEWGKRLQGAIAGAFEEEYAVRVERADHRYYEAEPGSHFGCSIDHIIREVEPGAAHGLHRDIQQFYDAYGPGILEIKNVDSWIFRDEWQDERAPNHIEIQVQHQLGVTHYRWAVIFALVGGNHTHTILRERNDAAANELEDRIGKFWEDYNKGVMPDPMMPRDARALKLLFGNVDAESILDAKGDAKLLELVENYRESVALRKNADEQANVAQARIFEHIGAHARVENCGPYKIWAGHVKPTHVEYDREGYRGFKITTRRKKADGKNGS